jgi:hypothetical protein
LSDLPYPFTRADDYPYYQVALGNGEYVWVVLAGDYRALQAELDTYKDLYAEELLRGK